MKTIRHLGIGALLAALVVCSGCIGEGEQEFRPTPGVINISY